MPPQELTDSADVRGNEEGWRPDRFSEALAIARRLGVACIGGQFQFRLPDATCELYWLRADASPRSPGESWEYYAERTVAEVGTKFARLMTEADFDHEIVGWDLLRSKKEQGVDLMQYLYFIAYFEAEDEYKARGA